MLDDTLIRAMLKGIGGKSDITVDRDQANNVE